MSLRKRIADSPAVNRRTEDALAAYVRLAQRTSSWSRTGFEPMDDAVAAGEPIILVLWHQRLIMAPFMFPTALGRFSSLTSASRAGRLAGQVLGRFGFDTVPMSSHQRHVTLSREVLRRIRDGSSIGIAADGPRGPARIASTVPLVWARSSGCRVFCVSFAARRVITCPTWDKMMLPVPYSRGVFLCREWAQEVPRKAPDHEIERLRLNLQGLLDTVTDAADSAVGRAPGAHGTARAPLPPR